MANDPIEQEILKHFGGVNNNSLIHILNSTDPNDETFLIESGYIEPSILTNFLSKYSNNFTVLSLNIQSLNAKFNELCIFLSNLNHCGFFFSAICLQETWITDLKHGYDLLSLPNYHTIPLKASVSSHGGLVTYLHKDFNYKKRELYSTSAFWEGQFIDISSSFLKHKITLGNIYRPPRDNLEHIQIFLDNINPIFEQISNENSEIVLAGDFNLDLLNVNNKQIISAYFDLFLSYNFIPSITLPTRIHNSATLIDNIFCKTSRNEYIKHSGIILNNLSDHLPCFLSIDFKINPKKYPKTIQIQKHNSTAITNFIDEIINSHIMTHMETSPLCDPNINYNKMSSILEKAKEKHLPVKTVKFKKRKHKIAPWITTGIIHSINYRDKLYKNLKKCDPSSSQFLDLKNNLKTYNSILRKSIRSAKLTFYHSEFVKFKRDTKRTWGVVQSVLNNNAHCLKEFPKYFVINGKNVEDTYAIADGFNRFFANIGKELADKIIGPSNCSFKDYLILKTRSVFSFSSTTPSTVLSTIKNFPSKSSSGHDNLSMKILKSVSQVICEPLCLIINQSFTTGIFPEFLKLAKVLPVFKKENNAVFTNYRPISLLPILSKIFEKIAYNQLYTYLVDNKLLFISQHGFRTNHSTETACYEFLDRINNFLDDGFLPLCIYLDLSKAFDSLNHQILIEKLRFYGVNDCSLKWFSSYLTNRVQYVSYNGCKSQTLPLLTGVPQGSILGPLLFLVYINDIHRASNSFSTILYADDTTLIYPLSPSNINDGIDFTNQEIIKIQKWLSLNKLSLNTTKTNCMIFHFPQRKLDFNTIPPLKLDNNPVTYTQDFDFLGLTVNHHLSWKAHVSKISTKISRANGILRRLQNTLPHHILKLLYNSLILPHLNYCLLAWGLSNKRVIGLQKKSIRYINKAKYNSHTEPLFKSCKLLKFNDLFTLKSLKFFYKYSQNSIPDYFTGMFQPIQNLHIYGTRNRSHARPQTPQMLSCSNCLRYSVPNLLSNTPDCILSKVYTHSFEGFSNYIKTFILHNYVSECSIVNCYVCSLPREDNDI